MDDEQAQEITYDNIRQVGGLGGEDPIANNDSLKDLHIIGEQRVAELETRIIEDLENLTPTAYRIGLDDFDEIDDDSEVGEVVNIVANAKPKKKKKSVKVAAPKNL